MTVLGFCRKHCGYSEVVSAAVAKSLYFDCRINEMFYLMGTITRLRIDGSCFQRKRFDEDTIFSFDWDNVPILSMA
jgi:hypothetical protein